MRKLAIFALAIPVGLMVIVNLVRAVVDAITGALRGLATAIGGASSGAGSVMSTVQTVVHTAVTVLGLVLVVAVVGAVLMRRSLPWRAHRMLRVWCGARKETPRELRPRFRRAWRVNRHVWLVAWRMPVRMTTEFLNQNRSVLEEQIDASVRWWPDGGLVWMEAGMAPLPRRVDFAQFAGWLDLRAEPATPSLEVVAG